MNVLTDKLPTKIKINGKNYDINYDYRTIINILIAFEDDELSNYEKCYIMLNNLYKDEIPNENLEEAVTKAIRFIDCDQEYKTNTSDQRIFSFKKDAMYIFSGINATHHIDIEENNIHWWKFMSLFMDMKPDCMFGELTYYRKRKNDGKLTKEEKEQYKKIKDLVDLEDKVVTKQSEARKEFFKEFHKS